MVSRRCNALKYCCLFHISRKMSLGKINELGHFVSDFDPEPDHDKKRKGKQMHILTLKVLVTTIDALGHF